MKAKSVLRRLEQLEKTMLPPKRGGSIVVFVYEGETIDYTQFEGYDEVHFIIEDRLPE